VTAADVNWNAVTLAGSFVAGAVFSAIAVIVVVRAVFGVVHREIRNRPSEDEPPE